MGLAIPNSRGGCVIHVATRQRGVNSARARRCDNRPMPSKGAPSSPRASAGPGAGDLDERELETLESLLDAVPAPLEPLDAGMLDGFLCGVLLQPREVPAAQWLPHVTDADGRPVPPSFDTKRLHMLVLRRHAVLDQAIARRQWFDPWVFELNDDDTRDATRDATSREDDADEDAAPAAIDAVYPWVAGFALALDTFPALMNLDAQALLEPLALVYRHLAPDDLEDADDLLAEIETLEPPVDLTEAVEGLVRATLLIADISRPVAAAPRGPRPPPRGSGRRR